MRNLKTFIAYRGTNYHGFQRQENAFTVQEAVETALSKLLAGKATIYGVSRTDTGVHALEYCFNFFTEKPISTVGVVRGLNTLLPRDIAALSCEEVELEFHARYACVAKEYIYKIHNAESPDPFTTDLALHYPRPLDIDLINRAGSVFVGTHDFKSFCSSGSDKEITVRTIYDFCVKKNDKMVIILVKGDGFLYNMVRIMVGTLLAVNEGKLAVEDIPALLLAKSRAHIGKTARAHGLYLNKIFY